MGSKTLSLLASLIGLLGIVLIFLIIFIIYRKATKKNPLGFFSLVIGLLVVALFYPIGIKGIILLLRDYLLYVTDYFLNSSPTSSLSPDYLIKLVFNSQLWYQTIVFVLSFVFVSFIISKIADYLRNTLGVPSRIILIKNILVVVLLVIAIYFSLSSIIAIPLIKIQPEDETKLSEELLIELNEYSKNDNKLREDYLNFITEYISTYESDTVIYNHLKIKIDTSDYVRQVNSVFRNLELIKNMAVSRMQGTDNSKLTATSRMKDKNYLTLWYLDKRGGLQNDLNTLQSLITSYAYSSSIMYTLDNESLKDPIWNIGSRLSNWSDSRTPYVKPGPSPGSGLGVFTFFSGWLIDIDSYPLVLIVGLIGFGLLGAGGSTFISEHRHQTELLIKDLPGVLIKGFTAAIVVFLGVQAGMAILTTNTPELNAYALFFTTFVAAVFSDDAWKWAKSKFVKDFSSENDNESNDQQKITSS